MAVEQRIEQGGIADVAAHRDQRGMHIGIRMQVEIDARETLIEQAAFQHAAEET
jgi:hypothetical protein